MLTFLSLCLFAVVQPSPETPSKYYAPGLTAENLAAGCIALFDGETAYGWTKTGDVKVEKGMLILSGDKNAGITTTSAFDAFEMKIQYRFAGETGVMTINSADQADSKSIIATKPMPSFAEKDVVVPVSKKMGSITIGTRAGTVLQIKSILIKPLGTKSIFNGKDLDGWKEIPGRKSKFSVTSAGELNVKDGNGDLQTTQQWDNFVLQLDIISNGDHLNSGIFFRALPGEFWSGYEAQVRNEWQTTVKLKDGKSHTGSLTMVGDKLELKVGRQKLSFDKSEVEAIVDLRDKPIDFGSGGIYHHCQARKVVSTDRQWYTMTVIAHGNHLAVWVNGYQTAEFTDKRPVNRSARQGRKDDAGCLSIQGHDPTTDLSFKNIRIAGLAK